MQIKFECPHCGQHLSAADVEVGISAPCPNCSESVTVPQSSPHAAAPVSELEVGSHDQTSTISERPADGRRNPRICPPPSHPLTIRKLIFNLVLSSVVLVVAVIWARSNGSAQHTAGIDPLKQQAIEKLDSKLKRSADENGSRFIGLQRAVQTTGDGNFVASITFFEPDQSIKPDQECMAEQFIVTARFVTEWRLQQAIMRPVFIRNGIVTATRGEDIFEKGQGFSTRASSSAFMATGVDGRECVKCFATDPVSPFCRQVPRLGLEYEMRLQFALYILEKRRMLLCLRQSL